MSTRHRRRLVEPSALTKAGPNRLAQGCQVHGPGSQFRATPNAKAVDVDCARSTAAGHTAGTTCCTPTKKPQPVGTVVHRDSPGDHPASRCQASIRSAGRTPPPGTHLLSPSPRRPPGWPPAPRRSPPPGRRAAVPRVRSARGPGRRSRFRSPAARPYGESEAIPDGLDHGSHTHDGRFGLDRLHGDQTASTGRCPRAPRARLRQRLSPEAGPARDSGQIDRQDRSAVDRREPERGSRFV
jgi:hypothetical protein